MRRSVHLGQPWKLRLQGLEPRLNTGDYLGPGKSSLVPPALSNDSDMYCRKGRRPCRPLSPTRRHFTLGAAFAGRLWLSFPSEAGSTCRTMSRVEKWQLLEMPTNKRVRSAQALKLSLSLERKTSVPRKPKGLAGDRGFVVGLSNTSTGPGYGQQGLAS